MHLLQRQRVRWTWSSAVKARCGRAPPALTEKPGGGVSFIDRNQPDICQLSLQYGAGPDSMDDSGKTTCHCCAGPGRAGQMATITSLNSAEYCQDAKDLTHLILYIILNGKLGVAKAFSVVRRRQRGSDHAGVIVSGRFQGQAVGFGSREAPV